MVAQSMLSGPTATMDCIEAGHNDMANDSGCSKDIQRTPGCPRVRHLRVIDTPLRSERHSRVVQIMRRCRPVILTVGLLAICARATAQTGKLDPVLQQRLGLLFGQSKVVVTAPDASPIAAVDQAIQFVGGTLGRALPIINGRVATIPNYALAVLAQSPMVLHVAADRLIVGANERTGPTVGATTVRQTLGLDGSGVGIAVVDSGITGWHDDLTDSSGTLQRVDRFVDFVNQRAQPYDDYGHGTHVAGIIAGNGFDSSGARAGIAPGAHLIALKVLDGSGSGHVSDVIAALDYVLAHSSELHVRIVNLSVATYVSESYYTDPLTLAARRLVDQGIVVVAAAGNGGRDAQGRTEYGAITAPGNAPWVLTVGASSTMGTIDRSDDTIAAFSSRGPTAFDRLAKPDVVAPGVGTESLSVANSALYNSLSAYLLSGTVPTSSFPYLSLSGTSQATPVVAGTVALMLQANPALTPNAVKAILQYTAQIYPAYNVLTQGAGFLNARGAVELARFLGSSGTLPYPSPDGWGQQLIWGNQRVRGGVLTSTANAWDEGVVWGQARTKSGGNVAWGVICATNCQGDPSTWDPWQTSCVDPGCATVTWGNGTSDNVVWGSQCGGADCQSGLLVGALSPNAATAPGGPIIWGSSASDTVVWGTSDSDTVVWGTNCADPSCQPVVWTTR
jgi:serine protease AprX